MKQGKARQAIDLSWLPPEQLHFYLMYSVVAHKILFKESVLI